MGVQWADPGIAFPRKGEHHPLLQPEHTDPAACAMVPPATPPAPAGTWACRPHTVPTACLGTASGAQHSPGSATHRLRSPGEVTHPPCALVLPHAANRPEMSRGKRRCDVLSQLSDASRAFGVPWVVSLTL